MLGKLIVCAPTRDGAIRKMRSALGELVIEGVVDAEKEKDKTEE